VLGRERLQRSLRRAADASGRGYVTVLRARRVDLIAIATHRPMPRAAPHADVKPEISGEVRERLPRPLAPGCCTS
jgi:hypothetical protein